MTQRGCFSELLAAMTGGPPTDARAGPAGQVSAAESSTGVRRAASGTRRTLDIDDPWYLPRPTDTTALSVARQPGQTLTIKGPRQMGKSSLLMRTIKAGLDVGKKVALLDFQLVDEKSKADADIFFRQFAVVDRRTARSTGHRRRALGLRVFEPAELHALHGEARARAARCPVCGRD